MTSTPTDLQKVKGDLTVELDKRIADKIIEKTNADLLKKLITSAETINEAIMIAELGTTYKRTGFHFDKRLEKMTDTIKFFKKNEKLSFVQDRNAPTHKLIIGDNYDALLNLLVQYRGAIDVIYIDPPYGKDSMGEFAKTNYENAITRDNLLSMLYPRLVLARQLLSDNGVIFCSIDDKNQAYVKGLFDEVLEESNFVANLIWNTKNASKGVPPVKMVTDIHEYVLAYSKTDRFKFKGITRTTDDFSNPDHDPRGLWRKEALVSTISQRTFDITDPETGNVFNRAWAFSPETLKTMIQEKRVLFPKTTDGTPLQKKFFDDYTNDSLPINTQIGTFQTRKATSDLMSIFNSEKLFANPKPIEVVKFLIEQSTSPSAVILDFFAGSGTTGQAVLELNKQDGGKRQFILATANEITETTPNGIVYDVTSKRLKRVMAGECYDGTKDFQWNEKNKPLGDNLDVYDIVTVAPYSDEPFIQIDETLYGREKLGVNEKVQWVCEHFEGTQKTLAEK